MTEGEWKTEKTINGGVFVTTKEGDLVATTNQIYAPLIVEAVNEYAKNVEALGRFCGRIQDLEAINANLLAALEALMKARVRDNEIGPVTTMAKDAIAAAKAGIVLKE